MPGRVLDDPWMEASLSSNFCSLLHLLFMSHQMDISVALQYPTLATLAIQACRLCIISGPSHTAQVVRMMGTRDRVSHARAEHFRNRINARLA
jgi:hypothetical protein